MSVGVGGASVGAGVSVGGTAVAVAAWVDRTVVGAPSAGTSVGGTTVAAGAHAASSKVKINKTGCILFMANHSFDWLAMGRSRLCCPGLTAHCTNVRSVVWQLTPPIYQILAGHDVR
jgi:hypothetical protein